MIDQYNKIATEVCALMQKDGKENPIIVLTTSLADSDIAADIATVAAGIQNAFLGLDKASTLINARLSGKNCASIHGSIGSISLVPSDNPKDIVNDIFVKEFIKKCSDGIILIVTDNISESSPAMFFAAESDGIILLEKKKLSRTDNIDSAMDIIKNLKAKPLGFVLV